MRKVKPLTFGPVHLAQMNLVTAILKEVSAQAPDHGVIPRQFNRIIDAANMIVAEFEQGYVPSRPGMGVVAWLRSDDTGLSSQFMCHILRGGPKADYAYPLDASDFDRCVKMLAACPGDEPVVKMAHTGPEWGRIVAHWHALIALHTAGKHKELSEAISKLVHE